MSTAKDVQEYRKRRKLNLIKVAGGKCNLCGYNKCSAALEFHHIDPALKSYGIAAGGTCHDLEKDLAEVKKTILVCSNCHREIHDGLYSPEELENKRVYNENIAEQLRQEKQELSTKTLHYCANCGVPISRGATLCEKCYHISRATVSDRPSREELKELIRTKPFTQVGLIYGVSDNAIRKWCDAVNLPRKSTEIKKYTDEEWASI